MKRISMLVAFGAVAVLATAGWAGTQAGTDNNITLTFEPFKAQAPTPAAARAAMALSGNRYGFQITSASGSIKVAGTDVTAAVRKQGALYFLGVDADGDGKIAANEVKLVNLVGGRARPMGFKIKAGGKDNAVMLTDLRCGLNGKTPYIFGNVLPGGFMKGTFQGVMIGLVDDNLDGQYTQDGKDAIFIARAPGALPLMKTHLIAKKLYQIKVTPDGDKAEFTPLDSAEVAQVRLPMKSTIARSVVMASAEGAYDMVEAGTIGVPPGDYKLVYGLVGDSRTTLMMMPDAGALTYPIQAGMVNIPRMGAPFRLDFHASYSGETLQVSNAGLRILGSGGEVYAPIEFDRGGNASTPKLRVMSGNKAAHSGSMGFG